MTTWMILTMAPPSNSHLQNNNHNHSRINRNEKCKTKKAVRIYALKGKKIICCMKVKGILITK